MSAQNVNCGAGVLGGALVGGLAGNQVGKGQGQDLARLRLHDHHHTGERPRLRQGPVQFLLRRVLDGLVQGQDDRAPLGGRLLGVAHRAAARVDLDGHLGRPPADLAVEGVLDPAHPRVVDAHVAQDLRGQVALRVVAAVLGEKADALELQIATDVQNAAYNVQSTLEAVQASIKARELAQERLNAVQSKLDVGMATNFEVVQAQRDLFDQQNAELRALLNYRKALVNFETVQTVGTRGVAAVGGGGGL